MSSSVSELLIIDGDVLDGSGAPAERADVLVRNGLIAAVGSDLAQSLPGHAPMTTIDAAGLVISPGFVDIHTHSDPVPLMDAPQPFKLLQGVTTEVIGNCGSSHGGLREDALSDLGITDALRGHTSAGLFATYLDLMAEVGPTNHIATLVGHTTLRERANGHGRSLEPGALEKMSDLIEVAFDAGALGLSSGLEYPPGSYADVDEMTALAKVAARWGRPYVTHVRNESEYVVGAIEEAIEVARRSGVQLQISHCKASGPAVHGFAPKILEMINSARTEGIDVAGDVYPYAACSTPASALLPPAILQEGRAAMLRDLSDPQARRRWRRVAEDAAQPVGAGIWRETLPDVVRFVMHRESAYVNRTLAELSGDRDPWETLCSLIVRDPDCFTVLATMTDEDVRTFVSGPDMIIASDSVWPLDHGHPRTWGTFPHFLGHYVRDLGLVSLPDAIRKITSVPARRFGLERGTLAPGAVADITVFDPRTIAHDPDPLRPNNQPSGIQHVLLAGAAVVVNGEFSGGRHGSVLRRPGSSVGSRAAR